jgi:O-antigen/teichoic acid export membrane protein
MAVMSPRRAIGSLTVVNAITFGTALVSGPLLAHALGPEGRGLLAAILVTTTFAAWLFDFGRAAYCGHAAARGMDVGVLFGSMLVLCAVSGLAGLGVGIAAAPLVAQGRDVVSTYLSIGFILLPLGLAITVLSGISIGLERWSAVIAYRLILAFGSLLALVVLFAAGSLTVGSAVIVTFVATYVAAIPLLRTVWRHRLRASPEVMRTGSVFGVKAWTGGLASMANLRLDQLLMAPLVSTRQLGYYAVAVTLSSVSGIFTGAAMQVVTPRAASGRVDEVASITRISLIVVCGLAVALAVTAPFVLPFLFGSAFGAAVPMAEVLLVGAIPLGGVAVLGSALTGAGHPGGTARAELIALFVTVIGLLVFLPSYGGMGAAVVSAAAYTLDFAILVFFAVRHLGGQAHTWFVPRGSDLRAIVDVARSGARRVTSAVSSPSAQGAGT